MEHNSLVKKILRKLNRENISLKLSKCEFAKQKCEWLGHRITETGVTPLKRKTWPIEALSAPETVTKIEIIHGLDPQPSIKLTGYSRNVSFSKAAPQQEE